MLTYTYKETWTNFNLSTKIMIRVSDYRCLQIISNQRVVILLRFKNNNILNLIGPDKYMCNVEIVSHRFKNYCTPLKLIRLTENISTLKWVFGSSILCKPVTLHHFKVLLLIFICNSLTVLYGCVFMLLDSIYDKIGLLSAAL